jgi:xylulokinase
VERARREGIDPYELLTVEAEEAEPGCEGLLFLPYLTGERCPHPDPQARGGWIGGGPLPPWVYFFPRVGGLDY